MTDLERLDVLVHGRVQGVGFRMYVVRVARRLGITGWVANESSGGVRCVAEGVRPDLDQLLQSLREGPPGAFVDRVDAAWSTATVGFERFEVRSGSHPGD